MIRAFTRCALGAAGLWLATSPAVAQSAPALPKAFGPQIAADAPSPSPRSDQELTAPLIPLDRFKLTPPPKAAAAQVPPSVAYSLQIEGLNGVGLDGEFRRFSALEAGKGEAASELQIRVRAAHDKRLAERILATEGYYLGTASITVRPAAIPARFDVVLRASAGPRFHFGKVVVTGPATKPPDLARKALDLEPGQAIVATAVRAAEAQVSLRLPQKGYPFVKLGERTIALDRAEATGDYALPVSPGSRSSFGAFQIDEPVFKSRHVWVIARFRPGELYDSRKVDDLRRALIATQLFSTAGIEPIDTGRRAEDGTEIADLRVDGKDAPTHTLSASLGYETGIGPKVEASWSDLNLFPPEGALILNGTLGTQEQLLGIEFRRSNAGRRDRTIDALIQGSRQTTAAYAAFTGLVQASMARSSTPLWQKVWTWSLGVETEVSSEKAWSLADGRQAWQVYKIAGLRLLGGYDRSNSLLDPTRGFKILATATPEAELADGTYGFLAATLEGRGYVPLSKAFVLAARLRLGTILGIGAQALAPSRRLYEGGGDTIRGYAYQEVGPKAPDGSPLGGASSTNFSLEGRYRFGDWGLVSFLDGGQAYEGALPGFSDLRFGAGLGARYYTSFGPIRIDVATPIGRRPKEGVIGVYISIGQAF
ncbi:MAG: autotransporter assembly complex protein TamA [Caulobacteraceae bacterium]